MTSQNYELIIERTEQSDTMWHDFEIDAMKRCQLQADMCSLRTNKTHGLLRVS